MKKDNKTLNRILAFLLCAMMIITYMPTSTFTLADETADDVVVTQDEPAPAPEPAPKTESAPKAEPAPEPEPAPAPEPEPAAEPAAPEPVPEAEPAEGEPAPDEAEPAEEDGEVPADVVEGENPEALVEEEAPEEEAFPEFNHEQHVDGMLVKIHAGEGALPEGVRVEITPAATAEVENAVKAKMGEKTEVVKAVDITFYKADGEKTEPKKPISVKFISDAIAAADNAEVLHIADSGKVEGADNGSVNGSTASFKSDDFSVYVIVGTPEETSTPRVIVNFYERPTDSTPLATMYVKGGTGSGDFTPDTQAEINQIVYDPSGDIDLDAAEVFYGWTTNSAYTIDEAKTAKAIEGVRTDVKTTAAGLGSSDVTVNYYAVICKSYFVDYKDEKGIVLGSNEIRFLPSESSTQSYTVNMTYTPADELHNFEGWKVESGGSNIEGYTDGKVYENETIISISGDVVFSVNNPEGHWLIFDENGKGATYNAPQFLKSADVTSDPNTTERPMTRVGYTFGGWFDSKAHADDLSSETGKFVFGNTISEKTTVYARWIPVADAKYTVVIWKQSVNGGDNYDFVETKQITAAVNSTPDAVTTSGEGNNRVATVDGTTYRWTGFHFESTDQETQTVEGDDSTVVNVYYNRNEHTLTFQVQGSSASYTYTATTSNRGTQYGLVDGEYVQLTRHNSGSFFNPSYYWTYGDTWTSEGTRYTGTRYIREYSYWTTIKEITALYGQSISDQFPIVGTDGVTYTAARWDPQSNTPYNEVLSYIDIMPDADVTFHKDNGGPGPSNYKDIYYYVEALPGDTDTVSYNGKTFVEYKHLVCDYNFFTEAEDYIEIPGFTKFGYQGTFGRNGTNTIRCYYTRNKYELSYWDGVYETNTGGSVDHTSRTTPLKEDNDILYNADMSSYNKGGSNYYDPAGVTGFVFGGWFLDSACTQPCTFTTMPENGMRVYARWVQKEYRVFLHPNAGRDGSLDWGRDDQSTSFRLAQGEKVSVPTGTRTEWEFVGWFTDEQFKKPFNDATAMNESTTTAYNQTEPTETDKWGDSTQGNYNKDNAEGRFWVVGKLDLYGQWRKVLEGAEGISVLYTAEGEDDEGSPVSGTCSDDKKLYKDSSNATAITGATPSDPNHRFEYWVVQRWDEATGTYVDTDVHVYAGGSYKVLKDDAKVVISKWVNPKDPKDISDTQDDIHTKIYEASYTVQLRAQYIKVDEETPTHIYWFKNDETTDKVREDTNLKINEPVTIPAKPSRAGYDFLGWARAEVPEGAETAIVPQDLDESDIYIYYKDGKYYSDSGFTSEVSKVAADERLAYHDMLAVWKQNKFTVTWKSQDGNETYETDENVTSGTQPSFDGTTPTKASTAQYDYTFAGWATSPNQESGKAVSALPAVTEDVVYYAAFAPVLKKYNVTFVDEDGTTVLKEATEYDYGTAAADIAKPADPTKTATAEYTYTFAGWTPAIADVTADATYTATYTATKNKYTVTFVDEDGTTVLKEAAEYEYGTAAADIEKPADPTKAATAEYTYTFAGWTPDIADVTANATYKASYTAAENEITINYAAGTGGRVAPTSEKVAMVTGTIKGSTATPAEDYAFVNWTDEDGNVVSTDATFVPTEKKAATYTANFKSTKSGYVVHHYLKDSQTPEGYVNVAEDVTGSATIGSEFQASAATEFLKKFEGYDLIPIIPDAITIDEDPTKNVIDVFYTVPLTITAKSDSKTYDGSALAGEYTVAGALTESVGTRFKNDDRDIKEALGDAPSITNVPDGPKTYLTTAEQEALKSNIPGYYSLDFKQGTLTINPASVTITTGSGTKVYDGTALTNATASITGLVGGDADIVKVTATGSQIAVGSSSNTYSIDWGNVNTANYKVTENLGTLTVTQATVPGDDPTPGPGPGPGPGGGGGGPAVTPAGPAAPVAPAVVPDEPVPAAEPEVIPDDPTPKAEGVWALLNLIAAILTTLGAAIALFRKKEDEDEDEDAQNNMYKAEDEDENDNRGKKMLAAKIAGAVAGIAAPITFFLTEDMSLPMAMVDKWTVLMAVMLVAQIIAAALNKKASKLDDDEEGAEEAAH